MTIDVESMEGHTRTFTVNNADVAIPTLPTRLLADDDHDPLFQKRGCTSTHNPTDEVVRLQRMHGVYFNTKVSSAILHPKPDVNPDVHDGAAP